MNLKKITRYLSSTSIMERYGNEMRWMILMIFSRTFLAKEIDEDLEPKSVYECQKRHDWIKWKDAIQAELDSLNKRNVFRSIVLTPKYF